MKMKQLTVAMITLLLTASCSEKQQDYPFRNPDLPLEERIERLTIPTDTGGENRPNDERNPRHRAFGNPDLRLVERGSSRRGSCRTCDRIPASDRHGGYLRR